MAVPRFHSLRSLPSGRVRRQGLELITRYLRPGCCRGNDRISQVPGHTDSFVTKCHGSPLGVSPAMESWQVNFQFEVWQSSIWPVRTDRGIAGRIVEALANAATRRHQPGESNAHERRATDQRATNRDGPNCVVSTRTCPTPGPSRSTATGTTADDRRLLPAENEDNSAHIVTKAAGPSRR